VRPENAGSRWAGVPHKTLADEFVFAAERYGCDILNEKYSVAKDGARLIGGLELQMPSSSEYPEIPGQNYTIAYMGNNDMSKALVAATGTTVMVCHNGMLTGDLILSRKHTTGVDVFSEIHRAFRTAMNQFADTGTTINRMIETELSSADVDTAFMEIGRRGILPWSAVGKAWNELQNPSHEEFRNFKDRAFGVYQATNEVIKQRNPQDQLDGLHGLTNLLAAPIAA
jgi:hypothetical protein